ncbi:hypothetical protein [Desulfovibrio sp. JC010]|uniref:hypothetical protein n=1 Tax=Desulfovibrio sp. JC010 TaxID=2593641 RepID=UPI0013D50F86|nr:hypothetical protein [Desulfovibrio sp. JC010]NDV25894.1 hypothetical protein [Desulfovibrio sp. JC010]
MEKRVVAELTLDGSKLRIAESTQKSDSLKQVFPGSYWEDRFSRAALKNKYELTAPSAAMEVQSRVKSLSETLSSFRWPGQGFGLSSSRLVVNDPLLDKNISSSLTHKDDYQRYYRYYSRGFSGEAATSLDAGTYKFDMTLGSSTKNLEVDITGGMTNDQLLEAVRDAVNESTLPVQARIFKQNAVGSNPDDLMGTGSALAFSVNTAYVVTEENRGDSTQDLAAANKLSFSDTSGHLISNLELYATQKPIGPAEEGLYQLSNASAGGPSQFLTKAFDANATTTIAAGDYSIGYSIGTESGTIDFYVEDGDDWDTVLTRIANSAASTSDKIGAEKVDGKLVSPVYTGDDYYLIDGKAVNITAVNPKIGERLVLDPDSGLEVLGLNATAHPGSDSQMTIDGYSEVRVAGGEFALDRGRVTVEVDGSFGDSLPLRVVDAVTEMEKNVGLVTDSYNDLRKAILPAEDLFREGFADLWRDPVIDNEVDLEWMGLKEAEKDKLLWFDSDAFYDALLADPDKVRELLEDEEDGLFSRWQEVSDRVIENKVSSYLIPETSLPGPWLPEPSPRTELELEVKKELVDTFEDSFDFDFDDPTDDTGRLVSTKG